jgi:hypothetical protein
MVWQTPFTLSALLSSSDATNLETLRLDFHDEMVWLRPEDPRKLVRMLSNLKSVHLHNIFADCDLKWTLLFLEAAPSLERLYVKVSHHVCGRYKHADAENAEKTNVTWESAALDFKHYKLSLLDIKGFDDKEEKLMGYVKLVMERAVALRKIHLHGEEPCGRCDSISSRPAPLLPIRSMIMLNDGVIRKQLSDGSSSSSSVEIEIIIE